MFKKMYYWWKFQGRFIHIDIKYGINNLIHWFPIVWKDRNYDYSYILYTLRFKLKNTERCLMSKNRFESTERNCERIRLCIRLLDKIIDDFYSTEYLDYHLSNFEYKKLDSGRFEIIDNLIENNLPEYFKKYRLTYNRVIIDNPDLIEDTYIALRMGIELENKAKKILFNIIRDNYNSWWD